MLRGMKFGAFAHVGLYLIPLTGISVMILWNLLSNYLKEEKQTFSFFVKQFMNI